MPVWPWPRSYVLWPPRSPSVSSKPEPPLVVDSVTWPLYWLLPVPVSMASKLWSFLPVVASVMMCSRLGVPSFCTPSRTVSKARAGLPSPAQTTLRALAAAFSFGCVDGTDMRASVALSTPLDFPSAAVWVTRSPPRTGRPA